MTFLEVVLALLGPSGPPEETAAEAVHKTLIREKCIATCAGCGLERVYEGPMDCPTEGCRWAVKKTT